MRSALPQLAAPALLPAASRPSASFCDKFSQSFNYLSLAYKCSSWAKSGIRLRPPCALSYEDKELDGTKRQQRREEEEQQVRSVARAAASASVPEEGTSATIISSCLVGLLTGVAVVVFNNAVHEISDFFWDGIPYRGASWLREEPVDVIWKQVILVPACGGLIVSFLNLLQTAPALQVDQDSASSPPPASSVSFAVSNKIKAALGSFLKAVAACVTLGTGNSLGPEGPCVEIGTSIAKGVGTSFDRNPNRKLSLAAAGSAAGISSGFNAAVAGCFFAVELVLWPSPPADSSFSLTNTTSMVILSAVIASVVSEVGLGSEPAFRLRLPLT